MRRYLFFLILPLLFSCQKDGNVLETIIASSDDTLFQNLIQHKDKYNIQVIYTEINRDADNQPHFTHHNFHVDDDVFYYPASTVKLPTSIFALEKLNKLSKPNLNKFTRMRIDSNYHWQTGMAIDSSSESGYPSVAHFIRRALLVSENDPYNRLYQFVGLQELNRKFKKYGFNHSQLSRQFLGLSEYQNTVTNSMSFLDEDGKVIYKQAEGHNLDSLDFSKPILIGKAHMANGKLVNEPLDLSNTNRFSLRDLQEMMQLLLFPTEEKHYDLTDEDYKFLYQYLSQYPSETNYPKYDAKTYPDSYVKYYFMDDSAKMPDHVRVFNKVGWAYGYLTDVSYVVDFKNNIEYMLTATIYTNENETLNDDTYEYESHGLPFFKELGELVYNHELARKRAHTPNLDRFKINYETRSPNDTPTTLKQVDN